MNSRQLHRGTMTVGVLLITYWAISGLTIAIVDATDRHQAWAVLGGGPGARLNETAANAAGVPSPATLTTGIGKALSVAAAHHMPIAAVDYRMTGNIPRLELSEASGERATELRFYAASGESMTARVADGEAFGPLPSYVVGRDRIKSFHKGDAWGLTGQFLGLITGTLLITLVVSGVTVYLRAWQARRKAGQTAFFWRSRESLWRRLHRTVAIFAAVFVLNKAVTGTILAWGEIQVQLAIHHVLPFPYPMPSPLPPFTEDRLFGDLLRALQVSFDAAKAAAPDAPIISIDLVRHSGQSRGLVSVGGSLPRALAFDMLTGASVEDPATSGIQIGNGYFADWHQILKRMHRGDIIGRFAGRYIDIGFGVVILYLLTSGLVLYGQMFRRRLAAGRSGLFWK